MAMYSLNLMRIALELAQHMQVIEKDWPARRWVIGHFQRDVPEGYVETVETGTNLLADPDLAAYYEHLRVIVADPLWSRHR
jgi:hypothetical protein